MWPGAIVRLLILTCAWLSSSLVLRPEPQQIHLPVVALNAQFGAALSYDEAFGWLAVGAPTSSCNFGSADVGCVFLYRRASNGTFIYQHLLYMYSRLEDKEPAYTALFDAYIKNPANTLNIGNTLTEFYMNKASILFADYYGFSLKLQGDFLIVGSPQWANTTNLHTINPSFTTPTGAFHIFRRDTKLDVSSNSSWVQEGKAMLWEEDQTRFHNETNFMDVRRTVKVFPGLGMSVDIVEYEGQMYAASGTDAWDAACGVDKGPLYIMRRDALTGTWSIIQRHLYPPDRWSGFAVSVALHVLPATSQLALYILAVSNTNRQGNRDLAAPLALHLALYNRAASRFEIATTVPLTSGSGNGVIDPRSFVMDRACADPIFPTANYKLSVVGDRVVLHVSGCTHPDGLCTYVFDASLQSAQPLPGLFPGRGSCAGDAVALSPSLDLAVSTAPEERPTPESLAKGHLYFRPASIRPVPAAPPLAPIVFGNVSSVASDSSLASPSYTEGAKATTATARCLGSTSLLVTATQQVIVADPCAAFSAGSVFVWTYAWTDTAFMPPPPPPASPESLGLRIPARLPLSVSIDMDASGTDASVQSSVLTALHRTLTSRCLQDRCTVARPSVNALFTTPRRIFIDATLVFTSAADASAFAALLRTAPERVFSWEHFWTGFVDGLRVTVGAVDVGAVETLPPPPPPPLASPTRSSPSIAAIGGGVGGGAGALLLLIIALLALHRRKRRRKALAAALAAKDSNKEASHASISLSLQTSGGPHDPFASAATGTTTTTSSVPFPSRSGGVTSSVFSEAKVVDGGSLYNFKGSIPPPPDVVRPTQFSSPLTSAAFVRKSQLGPLSHVFGGPPSATYLTGSSSASSSPSSTYHGLTAADIDWPQVLPPYWRDPSEVLSLFASDPTVSVLAGNVNQPDGTVVFAVHATHRGTSLAVKRRPLAIGRAFASFLREVQALGSCSHPSIITMYGYSVDATHSYLLTELAAEGSLQDHLKPSVSLLYHSRDDREAVSKAWLALKESVGRLIQEQGSVGCYTTLHFKGIIADHTGGQSDGLLQNPGLVMLEVRAGSTRITSSPLSLQATLLPSLLTCLQGLPPLGTLDRLALAANVWTAIAYLHAGKEEGLFSITHGDVRASNVVLTDAPRLIDFGDSRVTHADSAPESLCALVDPAEPRGAQQDVFGFGRLLLDLFDPRIPIQAPDDELSTQIRDVMLRLSALCTAPDASDRPTDHAIQQVLVQWLQVCREKGFDRAKDKATVLKTEFRELPL